MRRNGWTIAEVLFAVVIVTFWSTLAYWLIRGLIAVVRLLEAAPL